MVGILLPGEKVLDLRNILSYTSFPVRDRKKNAWTEAGKIMFSKMKNMHLL